MRHRCCTRRIDIAIMQMRVVAHISMFDLGEAVCRMRQWTCDRAHTSHTYWLVAETMSEAIFIGLF